MDRNGGNNIQLMNGDNDNNRCKVRTTNNYMAHMNIFDGLFSQYKPHYYCEFEGCQVLASCNYPSEGKKRFCGKHKLDGMVILNKPKCAFPGNCNVRPSFNYPGENKKAKYCFRHCLQGMEVGHHGIQIILSNIFCVQYSILLLLIRVYMKCINIF